MKQLKIKQGVLLSMLLVTLAASLLGHLGEGTIRAGQYFLILQHLLTDFEIQSCYQNEPKFKGVYSRKNLPKMKHGAYIINLMSTS